MPRHTTLCLDGAQQSHGHLQHHRALVIADDGLYVGRPSQHKATGHLADDVNLGDHLTYMVPAWGVSENFNLGVVASEPPLTFSAAGSPISDVYYSLLPFTTWPLAGRTGGGQR